MRCASYGGSGKKADHGRSHERAGQVPVSEHPQTGDGISQVMVFDKRCRGVQLIRRAGSKVVNRLGTLQSRSANGARSRMEGGPGLASHLIHSPAGGTAQLLHRLFGVFAKPGRRFLYCLLSSQGNPPKSAMVGLCKPRQERQGTFASIVIAMQASRVPRRQRTEAARTALSRQCLHLAVFAGWRAIQRIQTRALAMRVLRVYERVPPFSMADRERPRKSPLRRCPDSPRRKQCRPSRSM